MKNRTRTRRLPTWSIPTRPRQPSLPPRPARFPSQSLFQQIHKNRMKLQDRPRPSSSMMMRESFVAADRIADASSISAMKVEIPRCCASPAPTLAKTASRTLSSADSHGTKLPTYRHYSARHAGLYMRARWLKKKKKLSVMFSIKKSSVRVNCTTRDVWQHWCRRLTCVTSTAEQKQE